MSRFQIDLAGPEDDAGLRAVLAATPMEGRISVSFRREPSYFAAAEVDGRFRQVIVGRDREAGGRVAGFGSRSVGEAFVNGRRESVGYLSALRLLPEYRGWGSLVARGFRKFRELHQDARARLYVTTIAEGNEPALRILARGRKGMPAYHDAGRYLTASIPLRKRRARNAIGAEPRRGRLAVRRARAEDAPAIADFLEREGPWRQFFPAHEPGDFFSGRGAFRGLQPESLFLAFDGGELVGSFGAWDQTAFRQSVVEAYGAGLRLARPFYNAWARLRGRPRLPSPGAPFRYLMGAIPLAARGDAGLFSALLRAALDANSGGAADYLLLGLHETDPLLPAACRMPGVIWYSTRLFHVCWEDGEEFRRGLDGRPPYLELGSL